MNTFSILDQRKINIIYSLFRNKYSKISKSMKKSSISHKAKITYIDV